MSLHERPTSLRDGSTKLTRNRTISQTISYNLLWLHDPSGARRSAAVSGQ
jgi:hypothetical protein